MTSVSLVWFGLVWSGLVWSGLVWSGLVWFGLFVAEHISSCSEGEKKKVSTVNPWALKQDLFHPLSEAKEVCKFSSPVLRIRDVYPGYPIRPGSRVKKIPDPGFGSASKNLSILNPKNCFSEIWSGMLIPDPPDLNFLQTVLRIWDVDPGLTRPGSRSAKRNLSIFTQKTDTKFSKIRSGMFIPEPGSCLWIFSHPESGSRGQKSTGFRIGMSNTKQFACSVLRVKAL